MTEMFMRQNPDTTMELSGGATTEVAFNAVAVTSPLASLTGDPRVLNIGVEQDIV